MTYNQMEIQKRLESIAPYWSDIFFHVGIAAVVLLFIQAIGLAVFVVIQLKRKWRMMHSNVPASGKTSETETPEKTHEENGIVLP